MTFPVQKGLRCTCCGDALDASPANFLSPQEVHCRACRLAPPRFVRAVAYGPYEGQMREAIHALKYNQIHSAARGLGLLLAKAIAQLAGQAPSEMLVIPVPLHRSRYAQRGFNQARSLAVHALKSLRKTHPDWHLTLAARTLLRQRATKSQYGLTKRQRRINVRRAFSVSDAAIVEGKNILLVDDIFTTGATARAAALTLMRAGAASVWVATLARAGHGNLNTFNSFEESSATEEHINGSGNAPELGLGTFGIHSSQDQPSF